jgi:hypothetical protein
MLVSGSSVDAVRVDDRHAPSVPPPDRTITQRTTALQLANAVRCARAVLKRDLKAGRVRVVDVLLEPPEYAATMKVYDLLLAVPKFGRVKVSKALGRATISPSKTLGGMTVRQRAELVSLLGR